MCGGITSIFINAFPELPQHVSASHCHHQGVVISSEATQAIQTAWVASEGTTTPWSWQWLAETCWDKSRNALTKTMPLPRRICWLFYNNTTKMLGSTIKTFHTNFHKKLFSQIPVVPCGQKKEHEANMLFAFLWMRLKIYFHTQL
jgi:hypothetical protein